MGCGDAFLARNLKEHCTLNSFDLCKYNEFITPCDISKTPLGNSSVDYVVFCLSLMGTNFVDYLIEARRILKDKYIKLK
jgi:ribosomal RNA-processing protein 8